VKKTTHANVLNLKAARRNRLYEEIIAQIQNLINNGNLKSGDQLPPERELAEIFKVSRNSVREAIRALEEKSILQSRCLPFRRYAPAAADICTGRNGEP